MGKVFITSMNLKGRRAKPPSEYKCMVINVTSAQYIKSENRRDFSTLTPTGFTSPFTGETFNSFEFFWQSGHVFDCVDQEKTRVFWLKRKSPKNFLPKRRKKRLAHFNWASLDEPDQNMDCITARKKVYVPLYYQKMIVTEMAKYWKSFMNTDPTKNLLICDYDGPRAPADNVDEQLQCLEVTEEMLKEKINDPSFNFGHGYIVAAYMAGIDIEKFTN